MSCIEFISSRTVSNVINTVGLRSYCRFLTRALRTTTFYEMAEKRFYEDLENSDSGNEELGELGTNFFNNDLAIITEIVVQIAEKDPDFERVRSSATDIYLNERKRKRQR